MQFSRGSPTRFNIRNLALLHARFPSLTRTRVSSHATRAAGARFLFVRHARDSPAIRGFMRAEQRRIGSNTEAFELADMRGGARFIRRLFARTTPAIFRDPRDYDPRDALDVANEEKAKSRRRFSSSQIRRYGIATVPRQFCGLRSRQTRRRFQCRRDGDDRRESRVAAHRPTQIRVDFCESKRPAEENSS